MAAGIKSFLRYRVVNRITGVELTSDLPHLHQSQWSVVAMQPGNPGNTALGDFTIPLHPPGSPGYRKAKAIYDQLDRFLRVEAYMSGTGAVIGGAPRFAGPITDMPSDYGEKGDSFELRGHSDLYWAHHSMPFPGELLSNDVTSALLKSYLGTNEASPANDTFNPFTSGNYNQVALPGNTNGSWTSDTDEGIAVVKNSTGSGCALISKTGASANDRWHSQYVECRGRLLPSADGVNAGKVGVMLTKANNDGNNAIIGFVTVWKQNGRYYITATLEANLAGVAANTVGAIGILSNVDDPQGFIPLEIGVLATNGGNPSGTNASLIVNGKVVISQLLTSYDPGTGTNYPALIFGTPASGTATVYLRNLIQLTRFTTDGPSTAAAFGNGTSSTSTRSLGYGADPGASFLNIWTRLATREGWYWRYTPQAFTGSGGPPAAPRTLGLVDFAADPGADLTQSVIFKRGENLLHLGLSGNADQVMSGTATASVPSLDGGGMSFTRDIATMAKYGVLEDLTQAYTAPDFNTLRRYAAQIVANKVAVGAGGSKTAVLLRDPQTADRWRELDRIQIHDPWQNLNYLSARVLAYDFTEGDIRQNVVLDQFKSEA